MIANETILAKDLYQRSGISVAFSFSLRLRPCYFGLVESSVFKFCRVVGRMLVQCTASYVGHVRGYGHKAGHKMKM